MMGWLNSGAEPKKAKVQLNLFAKAAAPAKGSFTGDSHYARVMNKFTTGPVNIERYVSGDNKREGLQKAAKRKWSELKPGSKDGEYTKGDASGVLNYLAEHTTVTVDAAASGYFEQAISSTPKKVKPAPEISNSTPCNAPRGAYSNLLCALH
jgi:hypothetical protein